MINRDIIQKIALASTADYNLLDDYINNPKWLALQVLPVDKINNANLKALSWAAIVIPSLKVKLTKIIAKNFPISEWRSKYLDYSAQAKLWLAKAVLESGGNEAFANSLIDSASSNYEEKSDIESGKVVFMNTDITGVSVTPEIQVVGPSVSKVVGPSVSKSVSVDSPGFQVLTASTPDSIAKKRNAYVNELIAYFGNFKYLKNDVIKYVNDFLDSFESGKFGNIDYDIKNIPNDTANFLKKIANNYIKDFAPDGSGTNWDFLEQQNEIKKNDNTGRNILFLGAGGLALYFLMRKK